MSPVQQPNPDENPPQDVERLHVFQLTEAWADNPHYDAFDSAPGPGLRGHCDLEIVVFRWHTRDNRGEAQPDSLYTEVAAAYGIPRQFQDARNHGMTHCFGNERDRDGLNENVWIYFLAEVPATPADPGGWAKSGLILQRSVGVPVAGPLHDGSGSFKVRLILLDPPPVMNDYIDDLVDSANWPDVLRDPCIMVERAYFAWFCRVDKGAWVVTDHGRNTEMEIFDRTEALRNNDGRLNLDDPVVSDLDLTQAHIVAKSIDFMLESINAAMRSLDRAIAYHRSRIITSTPDHTLSNDVHTKFDYVKSLFESTKLRTVSTQTRIKNCIDLAFHIETMQDSRVNRAQGRSMRIIAILGSVFIPISTVTSIFGTQFFTSIIPAANSNSSSSNPSDSSNSSTSASGSDIGSQPPEQYMNVNPQFWILWAVAIPLAAAVLGMWFFWENWGWFKVVTGLLGKWASQKWASRRAWGCRVMNHDIELGNVPRH